jgi:ribosomal protein S20
MKKSRSVIKNIRKTQSRRKRNLIKKRTLKGAVRQIRRTSTKKQAFKAYQDTQSLIDKSVQDGIIKKRKAARLKSRLVKSIKTKK